MTRSKALANAESDDLIRMRKLLTSMGTCQSVSKATEKLFQRLPQQVKKISDFNICKEF